MKITVYAETGRQACPVPAPLVKMPILSTWPDATATAKSYSDQADAAKAEFDKCPGVQPIIALDFGGTVLDTGRHEWDAANKKWVMVGPIADDMIADLEHGRFYLDRRIYFGWLSGIEQENARAIYRRFKALGVTPITYFRWFENRPSWFQFAGDAELAAMPEGQRLGQIEKNKVQKCLANRFNNDYKAIGSCVLDMCYDAIREMFRSFDDWNGRFWLPNASNAPRAVLFADNDGHTLDTPSIDYSDRVLSGVGYYNSSHAATVLMGQQKMTGPPVSSAWLAPVPHVPHLHAAHSDDIIETRLRIMRDHMALHFCVIFVEQADEGRLPAIAAIVEKINAEAKWWTLTR